MYETLIFLLYFIRRSFKNTFLTIICYHYFSTEYRTSSMATGHVTLTSQ